MGYVESRPIEVPLSVLLTDLLQTDQSYDALTELVDKSILQAMRSIREKDAFHDQIADAFTAKLADQPETALPAAHRRSFIESVKFWLTTLRPVNETAISARWRLTDLQADSWRAPRRIMPQEAGD